MERRRRRRGLGPQWQAWTVQEMRNYRLQPTQSLADEMKERPDRSLEYAHDPGNRLSPRGASQNGNRNGQHGRDNDAVGQLRPCSSAAGNGAESFQSPHAGLPNREQACTDAYRRSDDSIDGEVPAGTDV